MLSKVLRMFKSSQARRKRKELKELKNELQERKIKNLKENIMTENDIKYRQGRSKRQVETNERIMFISAICLGTTLLLTIIFSLIGG